MVSSIYQVPITIRNTPFTADQDLLVTTAPATTAGVVFASDEFLGGGGGIIRVYFSFDAPVDMTVSIKRKRTGTVNSIADNGGQAVFNTGIAHGLFVGQSITTSGFTEGSYSTTATISVITTTSFELTGVTFVGGTESDSGSYVSAIQSLNLNADNNFIIKDNGYYRFDIGVEARDIINIQSSQTLTDINELRFQKIVNGA